MSIAIAMWILVLVLTAVVGSYFIGKNKPRPVEPKRFGLGEAEAARQFVTEPGQARAVKGVVVGVLGYEDMLAAEVATTRNMLQVRNDGHREDIGSHEDEIATLNAAITGLRDQIADGENRMADVEAVGQLFA